MANVESMGMRKSSVLTNQLQTAMVTYLAHTNMVILNSTLRQRCLVMIPFSIRSASMATFSRTSWPLCPETILEFVPLKASTPLLQLLILNGATQATTARERSQKLSFIKCLMKPVWLTIFCQATIAAGNLISQTTFQVKRPAKPTLKAFLTLENNTLNL